MGEVSDIVRKRISEGPFVRGEGSSQSLGDSKWTATRSFNHC